MGYERKGMRYMCDVFKVVNRFVVGGVVLKEG